MKISDSHYFDRCNSFCEFKPLSKSDTELVVNTVSDIGLDDAIVSFLHKSSAGTLRKIIKKIDYLEKLAEKTGKKSFCFDEIEQFLSKEN